SGAKDKRPALDQMIKDGKRKRFDVLVCWRLDRLGRNLRHLILLLDDLQALGIGFVTLGEGIYTDTNHMCAVIMNPNLPKWKSASPTPDEAKAGMDSLVAYCSTVEVHAKEGFVLHHVEVVKSPNVVGATRKRWFTFEGPNRLTLRMDASENNPPVVDN